MSFKHDWFSVHIPLWKKILEKYINKSNLNFLEIGCFEGRATKWLIENILISPSSKITVIDTFEGSMENKIKGYKIDNLLKRFKRNLKPYIFKKKIIIKKGISQNILRQFKPSETFDFIYIDGSHVAKDVLEDAILSWRLLKNGGIMVFDDYKWKMYNSPILCPRIAIDSFLTIYENQYKIVSLDYQVVIKKLGNNIIKNSYSKGRIISYEEIDKLNKEIIELKKKCIELQKIQGSKTYKLWQLYCKFRNKILNKT